MMIMNPRLGRFCKQEDGKQEVYIIAATTRLRILLSPPSFVSRHMDRILWAV